MRTAADRVPWSVTLIVVLGGFLYSLVAGGVDPASIVSGLEPRLDGAASLLLAAGMLGATVMPHVIYLHGALTQHRYARATEAERAALLRSQRIDVISAMGAAGVLNVIMLVVAARVLSQGPEPVTTIEAAHSGLTTALGPTAAVLSAVALLASSLPPPGGHPRGAGGDGMLPAPEDPAGTASSAHFGPCGRGDRQRVDVTRALVRSQVVLSFGILFALVPLVLFTRRRLMRAVVNRRATTALAAVMAGVIVTTNAALVVLTLSG